MAGIPTYATIAVFQSELGWHRARIHELEGTVSLLVPRVPPSQRPLRYLRSSSVSSLTWREW